MDDALYQLVQSKTAITDYIGDRFYPLIRPQGSSVPAATYRKVPSGRFYTDDGQEDITFQHFDIHVYARTYGEMQDIIETFDSELSGASGSFATKDIDYIWVQEVGDDNYLEDYELFTDMLEIKVVFC